MGYVASNHAPPDLVGVYLLKTGATSEKSAVPLEHLNRMERRTLAALLRKGVIFEVAAGGRYWVDADKLRERARVRVRFAIGMIVILVAVMVVLALYLK
jgi:hypothetical protein